MIGFARRAWPILVPLMIVAVFVGWRSVGGDQSSPDRSAIDVAAFGPTFATLEELVEASDLVVVATVSAAGPGRTITDPVDVTSGIQTTVFTLDVDENLTSNGLGAITVEHETSLLDGTPITIDGIAAPTVGERGLYFLIVGGSDDYPHFAITNGQGRFPIQGADLLALGDDELTQAIADRSLPTIIAEVEGPTD